MHGQGDGGPDDGGDDAVFGMVLVSCGCMFRGCVCGGGGVLDDGGDDAVWGGWFGFGVFGFLGVWWGVVVCVGGGFGRFGGMDACIYMCVYVILAHTLF